MAHALILCSQMSNKAVAVAEPAAALPIVHQPINNVANQYARTYFDEFVARFVITDNGTISASRPRLQAIESWFNQSHVMIAIITGQPLQPISFNYNLSNIAVTNRNKITLMHIYTQCYSVLLRMASILGVQVPAQYLPQLQVNDEQQVAAAAAATAAGGGGVAIVEEVADDDI